MKKREIVKNPRSPELSVLATYLITELCFRKDDEFGPVDALFVFGTSHGFECMINCISSVLKNGVTKKVIITGGMPTYEDSCPIEKPEAELILDRMPSEFKDVSFFAEKSSENTLENIDRAIRSGLFADVRRAMFLFKNHACGRGYLSLRSKLPAVDFLQQSFGVSYEEGVPKLARDSWWFNDFNRDRVWGEFLRIELYGQRGDIAYPPYVKGMVNVIRGEVGHEV